MSVTQKSGRERSPRQVESLEEGLTQRDTSVSRAD